jgi:hypothetical protein
MLLWSCPWKEPILKKETFFQYGLSNNCFNET